jgi:putative transposase
MLGVFCSGYYAWKGRPPSTRALRHLWLAGEITDVHKASAATYGALGRWPRAIDGSCRRAI